MKLITTDGEMAQDAPVESDGLTTERTMYAIAFDLNQDALKTRYPNDSFLNAYGQIGNLLRKRGFTNQQGSLYFGDKTVTPVTAVLAVQELATMYPWFCSAVVTDIRMLRIEENNDLNPAIKYVEDNKPPLTLDLGRTGS